MVYPPCLRRACPNCKGKLGAYDKPCAPCQTPIVDIIAALAEVEAEIEQRAAAGAPELPPHECGAPRETLAARHAWFRDARLLWERRLASGETLVPFPPKAPTEVQRAITEDAPS